MATCEKIRGRRRRVCVGDLDTQITLQKRSIVPPADGVDYTLAFSPNDGGITPIDVLAMVKTVNGQTLFDKHNVEQVITHHFYIAYDPEVTAETWILLNGERYDIFDVENLDQRDEFQLLKCNNRGTSAQSNNSL